MRSNKLKRSSIVEGEKGNKKPPPVRGGWTTERGRLGLILPARSGCLLRDLGALLRAQGLGARLPALQSSAPPKGDGGRVLLAGTWLVTRGESDDFRRQLIRVFRTVWRT